MYCLEGGSLNATVEFEKVKDVQHQVNDAFDFNEGFDPFYGVEDYNENNVNLSMNGDLFDVTTGTNMEVSDEGDSMDGDSNSDSELFLDEDNLVEEVDVDMRDFNLSIEREVESVGNKECDGQVIEVLDNDEFEEVGIEEDNRRKMLKEMQKPTKCSSGQVHKVCFKLGDQRRKGEKLNMNLQLEAAITGRN